MYVYILWIYMLKHGTCPKKMSPIGISRQKQQQVQLLCTLQTLATGYKENINHNITPADSNKSIFIRCVNKRKSTGRNREKREEREERGGGERDRREWWRERKWERVYLHRQSISKHRQDNGRFPVVSSEQLPKCSESDTKSPEELAKSNFIIHTKLLTLKYNKKIIKDSSALEEEVFWTRN